MTSPASPEKRGKRVKAAATPETETAAQRKRRATRLYQALERLYPDAHCELVHRNPFELLIATILSAQCTDKRVNMVTPTLFGRCPDPAAMATTPIEDIESMVRTTGFFRNKAKSIRGTSEKLVTEHDGQVPADMDALTALPGVARKTANVVLGNAFGINEGMVVDTHISRLANRLGLTANHDPGKIERDLMALFPARQWTTLAHLLIFHGRRVCAARKPACERCTLAKECPKIGVKSAT